MVAAGGPSEQHAQRATFRSDATGLMTNTGQTTTAELMSPPRRPRRAAGARLLGFVAVAIALLSALVTFLVLAGLTPIAPTHEVVVDAPGRQRVDRAAAARASSAREVWQVLQARRRGRAGARLHVRIVALFSVIAAVPAILVAVVASVTLDRGLDRLFSHAHRAAHRELADRRRRLSARARADRCAATSSRWPSTSTRAKPLFDQDRERFRQFLTAQASMRGLPARDADRRRRHASSSRPTSRSTQATSAAVAGRRSPTVDDDRAAGRAVPRRQLRGRHHQAARLRRHLSLRRPPARSAGRWRSCGRRARRASPSLPISRRAGSASRSPSR